MIEESWVLPLLINLNGQQIVTESGNILYKFEVITFKLLFLNYYYLI